MGSQRDDSHDRPASALGRDVAAHVEAIVHAAEREARAAERAIEERRRSAEDEVRRYLAAARLHVDAEAAARAAKLEALGSAVRRLTDELTDATAALNAELRRGEQELHAAVPRAPWPHAAQQSAGHAAADGAPAPAAPRRPERSPASAAAPPQPTWARSTPPPPQGAPDGASDAVVTAMPHVVAVPDPPAVESSNAARLVAIEMAVGGASRAEVERHLRDDVGVADPAALLDDVFGAESHASSRLAWGEP
ncbi:hypothetical protein [Conexibacter arvalis]|uniref:Uncharacterized protein n=1 Tax=Conexibacter arvalis TaxID=912552 RepID=A0A840ICK5_9ACTN|nr:hypothetical protein [Conexibacter arvalis]MBB4662566.1 hypothetical protein [Conexibacter arvalis]